jgi:hypothetical protein
MQLTQQVEAHATVSHVLLDINVPQLGWLFPRLAALVIILMSARKLHAKYAM